MKYKIVVSEIIEKEVPQIEYKQTGKKDDKGNPTYAYIETGKIEIQRTERSVYEQELDFLDVQDLAIHINRVKNEAQINAKHT